MKSTRIITIATAALIGFGGVATSAQAASPAKAKAERTVRHDIARMLSDQAVARSLFQVKADNSTGQVRDEDVASTKFRIGTCKTRSAKRVTCKVIVAGYDASGKAITMTIQTVRARLVHSGWTETVLGDSLDPNRYA